MNISDVMTFAFFIGILVDLACIFLTIVYLFEENKELVEKVFSRVSKFFIRDENSIEKFPNFLQ